MSREGEPTRITLDEATLLAWVEGELPPETHRRVSLALSREPRLRELAEGLLVDRDVFRAMGDETAPEGLLADVADALEREMLFGLHEEGTALSARPPKSVVARPGRAAQNGAHGAKGASSGQISISTGGMWQDRFGRRLAMAAGFLLLVGGVGTLGVLLWPDRSSPLAPSPSVLDGPIALSDPDERPAIDGSHEALADETALEEMFRTAQLPEPEAIVPDPPGGSSAIERAAEASRESLAQTETTQPAPVGRPLDTARAAKLAAEGRLLVRVRSVDLGEMLVGFDRLGTQRRVDIVPRDAFAADLGRLTDALEQQRRLMTAMASADTRRPESMPQHRRERGAPAPVLAEQVRVIEVAPDARELSLLRSRLMGEKALLVEFYATEEPMPVGAPPSPEQLLWWTLPPDRWTARVRVPVLIEGG